MPISFSLDLKSEEEKNGFIIKIVLKKIYLAVHWNKRYILFALLLVFCGSPERVISQRSPLKYLEVDIVFAYEERKWVCFDENLN